MINIIKEKLPALSSSAWAVREKSYIFGDTKVGAAVLSASGKIYVGCNVEHQFRCHDVHAEVNAVTNMVAAGEYDLVAVFVAAERERFTPCGSCMDWIFQFGKDSCVISYQAQIDGEITSYVFHEMMPYYPK